jgi:hypothetical protein
MGQARIGLRQVKRVEEQESNEEEEEEIITTTAETDFWSSYCVEEGTKEKAKGDESRYKSLDEFTWGGDCYEAPPIPVGQLDIIRVAAGTRIIRKWGWVRWGGSEHG